MVAYITDMEGEASKKVTDGSDVVTHMGFDRMYLMWPASKSCVFSRRLNVFQKEKVTLQTYGCLCHGPGGQREAAKKTEEVQAAVVQETVTSVTETAQHTEVVQKSEESAQVVVQAEKVVEPEPEEPKPLKTFVQKVWDNDAKDFKEVILTGEEAEKAEKDL